MRPTFLEWLVNVDKLIFILIHNDSDHEYLDLPFLVARNPLTWIPLYCFILGFAFIKFRKNALLFIVLSIVTVVVCDQLSATILKPLFQRSRPCFDESVKPFLRNIIDCGGIHSFPSSHSTNHFGLAAFWYWSLKKIANVRWKWLWIWAVLVGYAQVYVGKHFPLDVAGGAIIGTILGLIFSAIFSHFLNSNNRQEMSDHQKAMNLKQNNGSQGHLT